MTKGEVRKQRQAEHAAREQARLAAGDTRNRVERNSAEQVAIAKRERLAKRKARRPAPGSQQWAEERGGLIGGYETDETYCPD
jgi:hypothetical protein